MFASCLSKHHPDYGSVVYGSARPSYLKRLDYVHHQALRLCLGAFRTSPIPSLYAEAFEPSLSSRRDKLSLSYYFQILSNDKHPLCGTLLNGNNNRLFNARPSCIPHFGLCMRNILPDTFHGVKVHTNDFCGHPPWMENSISYINPFGNFTKSDSNNSVLISLFNQHRQFYQSYQPVFTDGSKSLNHVGCAFFTNGHIISHKLHSFTSVFSSEITAVCFALKYIDEHEIRKSILYTDSMSLLESLRSSSTHNPLIKEVKDFYRHLLSKGARILFSWVPSHAGITGNELADKCAKSATEFLTRPIVYADVRSAVNQWCHCQWQEKWNMETNNKLHVIKPIYALDARNHGDSPHEDDFDYPLMAEDVKFFMSSQSIPEAVIVGHSMGGRTAMHFHWSPKSPDMNIIEPIWDVLFRRDLHHLDLRTALQDSWCEKPPGYLQTLVDTMPRRVASTSVCSCWP
ncbi:hypothetical protein AVEN_36200-1 [Araneus ventricosus]|uniref:sn-1-specific diacylglycerol lipase ABHD11 n=1 Tax=Araneus ventricosus TaxID=182803 RepID=A0A4Y2STA0_ARAVE|nr:hypothetical protein AVEN_36200-1 [Araneus ventricosus]